MKNMRKKLAALLTFSVITVMTMGSGITAQAGDAFLSRDPSPTGMTPGGVYVYGYYYVENGFDEYYTTDFPIEYLMAIDAAGITNEMSDYEKCVRVNDYLCSVAENGVFDVSTRTKPRPDPDYPLSDGLDLLQYGVGKCSDYTDAFWIMTTMLGIKSNSCSSPSLNHAWNVVYIDDITYYIDVTWNDMDTYVNGVKTDYAPCKNRYLMSTELWDDHKAEDVQIGKILPYIEDVLEERAREEQEKNERQERIIEEFMKDPYKFFD